MVDYPHDSGRSHLMMLAFLIDQIQQHSCNLFKQALQTAKSKSRFWQQLRGLVKSFISVTVTPNLIWEHRWNIYNFFGIV